LATPLPPAIVLEALTDFSDARADRWPNIDRQHYRVHDQGPGWADVTEGSSVAGGTWERERYEWDVARGEVTVKTLDSNTWGPGSGWHYAIAPEESGGSVIDVTVERHGLGGRGKMVELLVGLGGRWLLKSQMQDAMRGLRA
jgi:hypothetical protein